jgi:PAS domain S-box-containing protein
MIVIEVVYNLLGLLALSVLSGFISSKFEKSDILGKVLQGIVFGLIALIGMIFPYRLAEGLIFDGRSIVISLCTLFFGPLSGIIATVISLSYRIWLGGIGVFMGGSVIVCSFLTGWYFYHLRRKVKIHLSNRNLYLFGVIVHLLMVASMILLPGSKIRETFNTLIISVIGVYPVMTLLIGKILTDQEQKLLVLDLITNKEASLRATLYSIAEGVITTDVFGSVMQMNNQAENLCGWKEKEAVGNNIEEFFHIYKEQSMEKINLPLNEVLEENSGQNFEMQALLKSKDKKHIPVSISLSKIKDDQGEIIGTVLVFRDQTQERIKIQELEESTALFSTAFHSSPVPMVLVSVEDGIFHDVNDMFLEETGFIKENVINHNSVQLDLYFDPRDREEMVKQIKSTGKAYGLPFVLRTKKGELKHCLLSSNIIKIKGKEFHLTSVLNVTQKMKDEALRHMQYNLASAMITSENLPDFFSMMKQELGKLIDTTNFIFALYDSRRNTLTTPFSSDEKDDITPTWQAEGSLTGYVVKQEKTILLTKDEISRLADEGKIQIIGTQAECWLGVPLIVQNKVLGVIVIQSYKDPYAYNKNSIEIVEIVARQFTLYIEKKRIEEESIKLSKAVVQSPVTIVITDLNGSIEYVNPKFTELTGYSYEDAIGQNPRILKSGQQPASFYQELWDTILDGKEWHGEFHNVKKNGEYFWESASIAPIIDSQGKITHFVAIKEDVTEKKKMHEELIKEKERAEQADKLKTSFLQNMSHEIRTPLNGILGFSHLLQRDNITTTDIKKFAQVISSSGDRLLELINNLIDISKIESGTLEVTRRQFNLNELVRSVTVQFKPLSSSKGIPLSFEAPNETEDLNIVTDELKLHQILTNLINNAFKFTASGFIKVGYSILENQIKFHVQDSGAGISEENKKKIFERFYQVDSSMTRGYEGSGLGLSICKGLLELLNGEIWVESKVNFGSTFYFTIPFALSDQSKSGIGKTLNEYKINFKNLLIAEDDEFSFFFLNELLSPYEIEITRVNNGLDAVKCCKDNPDIDIVLMDIKMPVMNGLDASKEIRKIRPELYIVAQTAYAFQSEREAAIEAGCDDYLSKPISIESLHKVLNR